MGMLLAKNVGYRYGHTNYGDCLPKLLYDNYGTHQMLAKNVGYRYGRPKLIALLLYFFYHNFDETKQEGGKNVVWMTGEWW